MDTTEIRVGLIGAGGFAQFAVQHFSQVPGFKLTAVYDASAATAEAAARRFGAEAATSVEALVGREDVDLVYMGTPPYLHHPHAMVALQAGKHVIGEKPFALTVEQSEEMIAAARDRNLLVVANLMQRYNPVYEAVKAVIESRVLGELLHATFENYAADEGLPLDHWFWDRDKSGGIFVEHGVHFFDMFQGWVGPGRVVAAQRTLRSGSGVEEQVHCTVRYRDGVLVNFYHGFTQPRRMDRQEMTFLFERGDVKLYEWIPVRVRIHAIVDQDETEKLRGLFEPAQLDVTAMYGGVDRSCSGRHNRYDVGELIELQHGAGVEKWHRYGELLRAMLTDQTAWIRNHAHVRKVTEQNGRDSVAMAVAADRMALESG
jgi:predicted dehydrogenase